MTEGLGGGRGLCITSKWGETVSVVTSHGVADCVSQFALCPVSCSHYSELGSRGIANIHLFFDLQGSNLIWLYLNTVSQFVR